MKLFKFKLKPGEKRTIRIIGLPLEFRRIERTENIPPISTCGECPFCKAGIEPKQIKTGG